MGTATIGRWNPRCQSEWLQLLGFLRAPEQGRPGPPRQEGPSDGFCQRPSATHQQFP